MSAATVAKRLTPDPAIEDRILRLLDGFDDDRADRVLHKIDDYETGAGRKFEGDELVRYVEKAIDDLESSPESRRPLTGAPIFKGQRRRGKPADYRPTVRITSELADVVDDCVRALQNARRILYVQGGHLVHVVHGDASGHRGKVPADTPSVRRVTAELMQLTLAEAARCLRLTRQEEWIPAAPPIQLAKSILALGEWPFPRLAMVTDSPYLARDGTIVTAAGFNPEGGILLTRDYPVIEISPDYHQRAVDAVIGLQQAFRTFKFADFEADWPATLAAVLTATGRASIEDCTPGFGFSSPEPQSGKGLLARTVSVIATGREPVEMPGDMNKDEWRKTLVMIASRGYRIVVIDNVEDTVRSGALSSVLTSRYPMARLLGKGDEDTGGPWVTTLFITGVNLRYGGDIAYRMLTVNIDPKCERPDQLKYEFDPVGFALQNRSDLHQHALTIMSAFQKAGAPVHGGARMGRYFAWDDRVRSALIWAGVADPIKSREKAIREADDDGEVRGVLYRAWHDAFGATAVTAAEAVARTQADETKTGRALREAITMLDTKGDGRQLTYRLGKFFERNKKRIVGGLMLTKEGEKGHVGRWKIGPPPEGRGDAWEGDDDAR